MAPGLHLVNKQTKAGSRWYVYAWRGGPCLLKTDGCKPTVTRELLDAQYRAREEHFGRQAEDVEWLIDGYKASPAYLGRKDATKKDYRLWLDRIAERFGTTPVEAFEDWRMRKDVVEWRDGWAHQPRTADKAIVMITTLLNWAVENGRLRQHNCHKIELLYVADKSKDIWEARHWRAVESEKDFPPHLMQALRLALHTGLRLGDLVELQWSQVFDKSIVVERTNKRNTRATIPMHPPLKALLDEIGRKNGAVLLNSRGTQWTANGIGTVWQRKKPAGFDRTIHDLRGTFATSLAAKGLTDQEIADIVGWKSREIAEIRRRYVNTEQTIIRLAERLSA